MSSADAQPSCDEVLDELGQYLDGELAEGRFDELREHLVRCYPCADRADFEEQLRAIVRRDCHDDAPPGLIDRIRTRLDEEAGA